MHANECGAVLISARFHLVKNVHFICLVILFLRVLRHVDLSVRVISIRPQSRVMRRMYTTYLGRKPSRLVECAYSELYGMSTGRTPKSGISDGSADGHIRQPFAPNA
jgi:hypothetical protein